MAVARALSFQNPGESVSCLSLAINAVLLSTSKKPPQNQDAVSHIFNLFNCHNCKIKKFKADNCIKQKAKFNTSP